MDKYIGFDINSKKTVACVVQKGEKDRYMSNGQASRWSVNLRPSLPHDCREAVCVREPEQKPWMAGSSSNESHDSCSLHQFCI